MNKAKKITVGLVMVLVLSLLTMSIVLAEPGNVTLAEGVNSRGTDLSLASIGAQAGNVTALNVDQMRITTIWQGFYGNVSGEIVLENSNGQNFYDWSFSTIQGEILATRDIIQDWTTLNCTNQSNMEDEEATLNIEASDIDGINDTFNSLSHPAFNITTVDFDANTCPSTRAYNSTEAGEFYNVALSHNKTSMVYVAIISDDKSAFSNSTADFEILLPTDEDTGLATYYFYAELG